MKFWRAHLLVVLASISAPAAWAVCPDPARPSAPQASFGPEQKPENVIIDAIQGAKQSIHLAAFAFSSPAMVEALVAARKRGVEVQAVVDHKHNVAEDPKRIGRKALDALAGAGAGVRTNDRYRIHHDKFMVIDACHVQTGSWNYAESARQNSENVIVLWNSPEVAAAYIKHWSARFVEGKDYSSPGK